MNTGKRLAVLVMMAAVLLAACDPKLVITPGATDDQSGFAWTAENLDAWTLYDPHNPERPGVIVPDGDAYRLDPNWEVESIEYVYRWWGLGDAVFDHQTVEREGDGFVNGAEWVQADKVRAVLEAMTQLHPTQMFLAGQSHTDDYPSWDIELIGLDGQRILLHSSSTGNPGSGPWNMLYNGRLYAQYNGALGEPLGKLFPGERGDPEASFFPGGREPDTAYFGTIGWPAQLQYGFSGLLPVADGFGYRADIDTGEIQGYIEGRSSIGGLGGMVIGAITELHSVDLTVSEDSTIACEIEPVATSDRAGAVWEFSCAPGNAARGDAYHYGLRIDLGTDAGDHFTTEGELWGIWQTEPDVMLLPLPEGLQAAIEAYEPARDLLADHPVALARYQAQIDAKDPLLGLITGEAILLGQRQIDSTTLRYTIGTSFVIEDGTLVRWDLNREALNGMIEEISRMALTRRALESDPGLVLSLWYGESGEPIEIAALWSSSWRGYAFELHACATAAHELPSADEPLRAFGFNTGWYFWQPDFILVDGAPVVGDLDLSPARDNRGGLLPVLIPAQFNAGEHAPFGRIRMDNGSYTGTPELTLYIPESVTTADMEAYRRIADSLPVSVDKTYDTLWRAANMTFVVKDDGTLEAAACRP